MSRRSLNPSRRVADGGLPTVGGLFHPKSRSPPVLTIALVVLGVILLIAYFNSGSGVTVTSREAVTRSEGSCTSEVMRALPYLKKAYGNAMQKVLHVGPDSCTVVSNLLKEGKVEAWGVEPYDLEDTDSTCKSLVRKGFVRMSDIKFPLPYRPDSFNLVVVSDALDYLTPRYLNKTLPDLARVSTDGLVIFAGNPGQQKAKVSELPKFGRPVTKDGCPIIFHDNFIFTQEDGKVSQKRVTDIQLEDFLQYGPQNEQGKVGKPLLRRLKDGRMVNWNVQSEDALCTLEEAFDKVNPRLGFNVELKFDDSLEYQEEELTRILQAILKVVFEYAKDRPILFSSFQPDAAQLMRKLQGTYPVYFLTNGGTELYTDVRRNSLEEAIKLCLASGLQGIVSEARGIFRHPAAVPKIKEANLSLLTYGTLNNVPEAVYMQHLMGVNGVIVDLVPEITEAVSELIALPEPDLEVDNLSNQAARGATTPNFSQREISFLLRLIPELVQ